MALDEQRHDEESEEAEDADFEHIHLPPDATMQDLFDAEGVWIGENDELLSYLDEEIIDLFDDDLHKEFMDVRGDPEAAAKVKVVDFFGGAFMAGYLPIRFDLSEVEWMAKKTQALASVIVPEPAKPIEEMDRDRALERIAAMFADVGEDLPPNEHWNAATKEAYNAVPLIVAARKLGAPDAYVRRCAREHVRTFVVGHERNRNAQLLNFGVIARFLKNMNFGTDDDVAFFEALASGDR